MRQVLIGHWKTAWILCAILIPAMFVVIDHATASGDAWIIMDPQLIHVHVGENFTITVNATNVDSMGLWNVVLKYNVTVMNVTEIWIPTGSVFGDPAVYQQFRAGPHYGKDFFDQLGYVDYGIAVYWGDVSVTNGILFKANCTALGEGTTTIQIATKTSPACDGPLPRLGWYSSLCVWDPNIGSGEYCEIIQPLRVKNAVMTTMAMPEFLTYVVRRFSCVSGSPLWDPDADINGDGKINMKDIGIAAKHFGEH